MKKLITLTLLLLVAKINSQPNCEAYKYYGEDLKYEACKAAEKRAGHYQFSRAYQEALDDALAIDSTFAFAYRAKSTAYAKSGDFIGFISLMNQAVQHDPVAHLGYRGWCRFQFFRDYRGAINDIEQLDSLITYDIGHSVNGDYHLHIARALCYKSLGQAEKAIDIINTQLAETDHMLGVFDYLHLGVCYLEAGQYEQAIVALERQAEENDLAENRYYLGLVYKMMENDEDYRKQMELAKTKYIAGTRMFDPYTAQVDKIYLADIEAELISPQ